MPISIRQGSTVEFIVEFLDVRGNLTVPPGGSVNVSYVNLSGSPVVDTVNLTLAGPRFFTGVWQSRLAKLGLASYNVVAPAGFTFVTDDPLLRIVRV